MERLQRVFIVVLVTIMLVLTQISPSYAQVVQNSPEDAFLPCAYTYISTDQLPLEIPLFSDKFVQASEYDFSDSANKPQLNLTAQFQLFDVKYRQVDQVNTKILGTEEKARTFCLRSYEYDKIRKTRAQLVGPTIRTAPGQMIDFTITNLLSLTSPVINDSPLVDTLSTTNFHSHGLHTSPKGISDNVLREMTTNLDPYKVQIIPDENQPTGTDWYHPHVHGMTAPQVGSGMEGALIVQEPTKTIGISEADHLPGVEEQIFVMQQIQMKDFKNKAYSSYPELPTMINGQIIPTIHIKQDEVRRWRFIHGGVRHSIHLELREEEETKNGNVPPSAMTPLKDGELGYGKTLWSKALGLPFGVYKVYEKEFLPKKFRKEKLPLHEIAVDGMPLGFMDSWTDLDLEPGYRSDVLVQFPRKGTYWLLDESSQPQFNVNLQEEDRQILAKVIVADEWTQSMLSTGWTVEQWSRALADRESEEKTELKLELAKTLSKEKLLKPITEDEWNDNDIIGVEFDITGQPPNFNFVVNGRKFNFSRNQANPKEFDVSPKPLSVVVTQKEEKSQANKWEIKSLTGNHPFHIHVNPFMTNRIGPKGEKEQIWKDTLFVRQDLGRIYQPYDHGKAQVGPGIPIFSRYLNYDGCAVIHCHILEHEDNGMMALVTYSNKRDVAGKVPMTLSECYAQKNGGGRGLKEYDKRPGEPKGPDNYTQQVKQ